MRFSQHLLGTTLLVGFCSCASVAATQLARAPASPVVEAAAASLRLAVVASFVPGDEQSPSSVATLSRPIFSPDRRPFVPPPPPPIAAAPELAIDAAQPMAQPAEALSLMGVLIEGDRRQALLAAPSFPDGRWLEVGATVSGYALVAIDEASVALSSGAGRISLQLYVDNLGEQPPTD